MGLCRSAARRSKQYFEILTLLRLPDIKANIGQFCVILNIFELAPFQMSRAVLSYAIRILVLTLIVGFFGFRFLQYHKDIQEDEKTLGYDPFTGRGYVSAES